MSSYRNDTSTLSNWEARRRMHTFENELGRHRSLLQQLEASRRLTNFDIDASRFSDVAPSSSRRLDFDSRLTMGHPGVQRHNTEMVNQDLERENMRLQWQLRALTQESNLRLDEEERRHREVESRLRDQATGAHALADSLRDRVSLLTSALGTLPVSGAGEPQTDLYKPTTQPIEPHVSTAEALARMAVIRSEAARRATFDRVALQAARAGEQAPDLRNPDLFREALGSSSLRGTDSLELLASVKSRSMTSPMREVHHLPGFGWTTLQEGGGCNHLGRDLRREFFHAKS